MTMYRTQIEFQPVSGLPEDVTVNTWHFEDAGDTDTETAGHAINGVMAAAYFTDTGALGNNLGEFISSSISRTNKPKLKTYAVDKATGLAISEPIEDLPAAFSAPIGAGPLPREIALCLSFHGDLTGLAEEVADTADAGLERDRPASRKRGRVYIGPLSQAALTAGTDSRPGAGIMAVSLRVGAYLLSGPAPLVTNELVPVVYSRKLRTTADITGFWVDNEWDTQRRRGLRRTTRSTVGTGL